MRRRDTYFPDPHFDWERQKEEREFEEEERLIALEQKAKVEIRETAQAQLNEVSATVANVSHILTYSDAVYELDVLDKIACIQKQVRELYELVGQKGYVEEGEPV